MNGAVLPVSIDTAVPNFSFFINGAAEVTTDRLVTLTIVADDDLGGQFDLREMAIRGDIDLSYDPRMGTFDVTPEWIRFRRSVKVMLSPSVWGDASIGVRLRDSVGNMSYEQWTVIALESPSTTYVNITRPPAYGRFSAESGYDGIHFSWTSSKDFTEYAVRVVANETDAYADGTPVSGTNVSGTGTWTAGQRIDSSISSVDLLTSEWSSGIVLLKVFVKANGVWSA